MTDCTTIMTHPQDVLVQVNIYEHSGEGGYTLHTVYQEACLSKVMLILKITIYSDIVFSSLLHYSIITLCQLYIHVHTHKRSR